jgi:hypothetical protein
MKFQVHWKGASGDPVDIGPSSLANAIALAEDQKRRGAFLYITDETGRRLTLEAAERLKASEDAQRF